MGANVIRGGAEAAFAGAARPGVARGADRRADTGAAGAAVPGAPASGGRAMSCATVTGRPLAPVHGLPAVPCTTVVRAASVAAPLAGTMIAMAAMIAAVPSFRYAHAARDGGRNPSSSRLGAWIMTNASSVQSPEMPVTHLFASIPVADRDAAVRWYERLAGRPPDLIPNDDEAAWRLTDTGWIYVIADRDRAGQALHTLLVDDLEAFLAGLTDRGIAAEPVTTIGGGVRRTMVTDPDGNRLQLGQPPD